MNDYLKAQIDAYCYMVKRGKPAAMLAIQNRHTEEIEEKVKNNQLNVYIEDLSNGWKTIWIYKEDYLIEIIKRMPEQPKDAYDHWVLGKIFGYSDDAIKNFIDTKLYDTLCDNT